MCSGCGFVSEQKSQCNGKVSDFAVREKQHIERTKNPTDKLSCLATYSVDSLKPLAAQLFIRLSGRYRWSE